MEGNFDNCFLCIMKSTKYKCIDCVFCIYRYTVRFVAVFEDSEERYQSIHFECLLENEQVLARLRELYTTPKEIHGYKELSMKQKQNLLAKFWVIQSKKLEEETKKEEEEDKIDFEIIIHNTT